MKQALESLQRVTHLLALFERERPGVGVDPYLQAARANALSASLLLEGHADPGPQSRRAAIELLLKAELALASVPSSSADLSLRIADQLLLEARVRLEALEAS